MDIEPRENTDLLTVNNKSSNGNVLHEEADRSTKRPPDGGVRAYAVVLGAFLTNGLLFGVINSYSVIYPVLQKQLENDGVPHSDSRASLVGALTMGTTFFLSPVSGVLTSLLGLRLTAVLGGSIAAVGLLISSFVTHSVLALFFTYGIMYGMGASFAYTPSLAILSHYFERHLGLVCGVVSIGSSVFTVIMPPLMNHMLKNYGLDWLLRLFAVFAFGVALCGLLFKPIPLVEIKPAEKHKGRIALLKSIIDIDIWKNRKYKYWALSMPIALFGYFVLYVHIKKHLEITFKDVNYDLPIQCIATASGIGRLVLGYLADRPGMDRIMLQQISFYAIGICTIILPFVKSFPLLVTLAFLMGICDGAFVSLIGPIAVELCGASHAAQAIGCMLGLSAPPLVIGPPIAGQLFRLYNSYTLPFVLAGISPLLGATLMFMIRFKCRQDGPRQEANGRADTVLTSAMDADTERSPVPLLMNGKANEQTAL